LQQKFDVFAKSDFKSLFSFLVFFIRVVLLIESVIKKYFA